MLFEPKDIYNILKQKGIETLFHANTVMTSSGYLENDSLISREKMESVGLPQTMQESDTKDKGLGIYNDIFLDTVDNHIRFNRSNYYGPVLFEIDIEILNKIQSGQILITKKNPADWDFSLKNGFYNSLQDIQRSYFGEHNNHIIYRDPSGMLNIKGFIKRLVLDDPNKNEPIPEVSIYDVAESSLEYSIGKSSLGIQVTKRDCQSIFCKCQNTYDNRIWYMLNKFMPNNQYQ